MVITEEVSPELTIQSSNRIRSDPSSAYFNNSCSSDENNPHEITSPIDMKKIFAD
jgi:hypothetical protein